MTALRTRVLYVFDFDNTIVDTALLISKDGYGYNFDDLNWHSGARKYLEHLVDRKSNIVVMSKRSRAWKTRISNLMQNVLHAEFPVMVVPIHALKWFFVHLFALRYRYVLVFDDMMRGEETGENIRLFFPPVMSRRVKIRRGERILRWRSGNTVAHTMSGAPR